MKGVVVFTATAYVLAAVVDLALYFLRAQGGGGPGQLVSLAAMIARMWAPTVAVIAALLVEGENPLRGLSGLLVWEKGAGDRVVKYYLLAPILAYAALGVYVALAQPLGLFDLRPVAKLIAEALANKTGHPVPLEQAYAVIWVQVSSAYIAAISVNAVAALGEEFGWRGYLYRRLFSQRPTASAVLVIGTVWGLWHATAIVLLGFNYPAARALGVPVFTVFAITLTYPMLLLTSRSKSILPPAALHGALNALWGLTAVTCPLQTSTGELVCGLGVLGIVSWGVVGAILFALDRVLAGEKS